MNVSFGNVVGDHMRSFCLHYGERMITTRIAFIVVVEDYHEVGHICEAIWGIDLSHRELGTTDTFHGLRYVGVIFNECSPGDGEIFDLLEKAGVELNDD